MTLASLTAIVCSLGFLAIGWKLHEWHAAAQKRRADAALILEQLGRRIYDVSVRREIRQWMQEDRARGIGWFDRGVRAEVHTDRRLTSLGGIS